jgi:hypothetical protein
MSATTEEHKHTWQSTMHLDGCHYYTNAFVCGGKGPPKKCGATVVYSGERSPKGGGGVWLDPETCDRCKELWNGAPVRFDMVLCDKEGNVIEETHEERPQTEESE